MLALVVAGCSGVMAPGEKKILVARKGRLRQRYDGEHRLVAGCVPYRMGADGHPELLMVSTPNRDDLVFPKVRNRRPSKLARWVLRSSAAQLDGIASPSSSSGTGRVGGRTTRTCTRRRAARRWRRPASRAPST